MLHSWIVNHRFSFCGQLVLLVNEFCGLRCFHTLYTYHFLLPVYILGLAARWTSLNTSDKQFQMQAGTTVTSAFNWFCVFLDMFWHLYCTNVLICVIGALIDSWMNAIPDLKGTLARWNSAKFSTTQSIVWLICDRWASLFSAFVGHRTVIMWIMGQLLCGSHRSRVTPMWPTVRSATTSIEPFGCCLSTRRISILWSQGVSWETECACSGVAT